MPPKASSEVSATSLAHRVLLHHPRGFRPFRGTDLFERIGGQATVDRFVDALYDGIEQDEVLRPMFVDSLTAERGNQKLFFGEWLGGEPRYSDTSWSSLAHRHEDLPITRSTAGLWLGHLRHALQEAVASEGDRSAIFDQAQALAMALVNTAPTPRAAKGTPVSRHRSSQVAACSTGGGAAGAWMVKRARDLVQRGDAAGVVRALKEAPDLVNRPIFGAALIHVAVLAGHVDVVELLLKRGVDANKPHFLAVTGPFARVLFVTPLCAARMKHRATVEALLMKKGAKDDVLTAAFLGDVPALETMLAADRSLAQATDPAVDALDITPVHHAVAGGHVEALRALVGQTDEPLKGSVRALQGAAARDDLPMVELLLEHGADATLIGVGRWVMHPKLAPILAGRGASIDSTGAWIGHCCTGNQGRKDDPEYVRALLRHGARADARRALGTLSATALHYAAKAGFSKTIEVLLENGADPCALDSRGATPLDWLDQSAKSVDKAKVRRLLSPGPAR